MVNLIGHSGGGQIGNRSPPLPFGPFPLPGGNSRVGRTPRIWVRRTVWGEEREDSRKETYCFKYDEMKIYDAIAQSTLMP